MDGVPDGVTPAFSTEDTLAEVDAAVRTQRRIASGYFGMFLGATLAVPLLTLLVPGWSTSRVLGGMSPNFVTAAAVLYLVFVAVAVAAARLAEDVEDRMLGSGVGNRPVEPGHEGRGDGPS